MMRLIGAMSCCAVLAACTLIAPLEDLRSSTSGAALADSDAGRAENASDAGRGKAGRDAGAATAGRGAAGRSAPDGQGTGGAAGDAEGDAGRGGSAGMSAASDAGSTEADAMPSEADAGASFEDAMCDPIDRETPRPGLTACAPGLACIVYDNQLRGRVAPTQCQPPGSGEEGTACTTNTDCVPGLFCEDEFLTCHRYCATNSDCPGLSLCLPLQPAFLLGNTQLTVGACPILPL